MRLTWIFALLLGLSVLTYLADASAAPMCKAPSSRAPASETCKYSAGDIKVVGIGDTMDQAFEDAAVKCFDTRRARFKSARGVDSDNETAELYIDLCANIRCS
jgi:hypothetical protein